MSPATPKTMLKGRFQKKSVFYANLSSSIVFSAELPQDQRVTVFDSSAAPQPFTDSNALEAIKKRDTKKSA